MEIHDHLHSEETASRERKKRRQIPTQKGLSIKARMWNERKKDFMKSFFFYDGKKMSANMAVHLPGLKQPTIASGDHEMVIRLYLMKLLFLFNVYFYLFAMPFESDITQLFVFSTYLAACCLRESLIRFSYTETKHTIFPFIASSCKLTQPL